MAKHQRVLELRSSFNALRAIVVVATFLLILVSLALTRKTGVWSEHLTMKMIHRCPGQQCDLFSGRWVFDNESNPSYSERNCSFLFEEFACETYGRKDLKYKNWRWQPHHCNLPRFNAASVLEKLRGKRLVFVGDSLNRNQWNSMVCLLDSAIPPSLKSIQTKGSLFAFKAMEYNASVEFYWSPLLVESNADHPINHRFPDRIIKANSIVKHARHWTNADILVFNSYIWWRKSKIKILWGSFEDKDAVYEEAEPLRSFQMVLKTWSDWLQVHVDRPNTQLFFVSLSPTHYWGDEWGAEEDLKCYNESKPITKEGYWGRGSDVRMMHAVETAVEGLKDRGVNVKIINITQLSEYRKDGHPSIYRKQWEPLTEKDIADPKSYADCVHWCLPGVPDVWNELLVAYLLPKSHCI